MALRTVIVESRPSDTIAGGSGAARPLPNLRNQPPGWCHTPSNDYVDSLRRHTPSNDYVDSLEYNPRRHFGTKQYLSQAKFFLELGREPTGPGLVVSLTVFYLWRWPPT